MLPPLVSAVVIDSAPSPAVLEELPTGYGVKVGAGVLEDDDEDDGAAGVLPPLVSAVVIDSAPSPQPRRARGAAHRIHGRCRCRRAR